MVPLAAGLAVLVFLVLLGRGFAFGDIGRLARGMRGTVGVVLGLAAIALLVSGRAGLALLAAAGAWPLLFGGAPPWQRAAAGSTGGSAGERAVRSGKMSRAEALKVLGLQEGASKEDIRAAHRRLILQTHPDRGGSDYLAAKINEAKDVLIGR